MTTFDLTEFLSEQVEDQVEAEKLYHAIIELGFGEQGTLRMLLRRYADVCALITEEFIPLAHKVARRELSGHTFRELCERLEATINAQDWTEEEVSDAAV